MDLILLVMLWAPATWCAGKWVAILTYIDPWKKPILDASGTPKNILICNFMVWILVKGGLIFRLTGVSLTTKNCRD